MKLLIVDVEPLIAQRIARFCRAILGQTLESLQIAGMFEEASAHLMEHPTDVLLLDLNLGGRDGMELLKASVAGSFHTIIVSANTENALRAFECGVLDFVPKPFTQERLAQALRRVTDATSRTMYGAKFLASLPAMPVIDDFVAALEFAASLAGDAVAERSAAAAS